jgi:osmotically inducible protein OsmC
MTSVPLPLKGVPVNDPRLSTEHAYSGSAFKPLYITRVAVSGGSSAHGRATGRARSADGALDLELRMPEELGGDTTGPNPEQLFAAGYAACFHGALSLLARRHLLDPEPITVEATVAVGRDPADGGYQLRADLVVAWPGVERDTATSLLAQATALCPYAKMTRHGIPATISLAP